jgi:hypothetical protein
MKHGAVSSTVHGGGKRRELGLVRAHEIIADNAVAVSKSVERAASPKYSRKTMLSKKTERAILSRRAARLTDQLDGPVESVSKEADCGARRPHSSRAPSGWTAP